MPSDGFLQDELNAIASGECDAENVRCPYGGNQLEFYVIYTHDFHMWHY